MQKLFGNFITFCSLITIFLSTSCAFSTSNSAYDLTVELEKNPVGLDISKPRLSWKLRPEAGKHGQMQTAFRILVATRPELLKEGFADVFDSQKVSSDECVLVDVMQKPLNPRTNYYWTVKIWDETGTAGDYAGPERFDTGYFDLDEWTKDGAMWLESPVKPRQTESVENWIRYAVVNIEGALWQRSQGRTAIRTRSV